MSNTSTRRIGTTVYTVEHTFSKSATMTAAEAIRHLILASVKAENPSQKVAADYFAVSLDRPHPEGYTVPHISGGDRYAG
jgi:hypothetical protein